MLGIEEVLTPWGIEEMLTPFHGKDVIVYGTGKIGRLLISYLCKKGKIHIRGVTNSRIQETDAGTFKDTGLPLRSVQAWHESVPGAVILVAVMAPDLQSQITAMCREAGFHQILCMTGRMAVELERTMMSSQDIHTFSRNMSFSTLWDRLTPNLFHMMCTANAIQDTHRASFGEFRNCHRGKDVVLVATGPTLNYYRQLKDTPHIGVNEAFRKKEITLDYYFTADFWRGIPFPDLKDYHCVKFIGQYVSASMADFYQAPEIYIEENQARRYFTGYPYESALPNIEYFPLMDFGSVAFHAFHFALYTRPKCIFLVGCDCTQGHFEPEPGFEDDQFNVLVPGWKTVKAFVERFHRGIEVVSINPVGLKGVFRDVYTESYLDAHPEIDRTKCEILDEQRTLISKDEANQ